MTRPNWWMTETPNNGCDFMSCCKVGEEKKKTCTRRQAAPLWRPDKPGGTWKNSTVPQTSSINSFRSVSTNFRHNTLLPQPTTTTPANTNSCWVGCRITAVILSSKNRFPSGATMSRTSCERPRLASTPDYPAMWTSTDALRDSVVVRYLRFVVEVVYITSTCLVVDCCLHVGFLYRCVLNQVCYCDKKDILFETVEKCTWYRGLVL